MDKKSLVKIAIMITMFSVANISLCMTVHRTPRTPIVRTTEAQRRAVQIIESQRRDDEKQDRKLLEHSCFKGESLKFQNEFFSSDQNLPMAQRRIQYIILGNDHDYAASLAYHQYYRKMCLSVLVGAEEYIKSIALSCAFQEKECFEKNKLEGLSGYIRLKNTLNISLMLFGAMNDAYRSNDYPVVLTLLEHMVRCDKNV